jgi:hypothetical protein
VSEIERAGGGEVERRRGIGPLNLVVYGLAAVGAYAIVSFVLGTVFSLAKIGLLIGVVVLVGFGVRAFLKGPPEP